MLAVTKTDHDLLEKAFCVIDLAHTITDLFYSHLSNRDDDAGFVVLLDATKLRDRSNRYGGGIRFSV